MPSNRSQKRDAIAYTICSSKEHLSADLVYTSLRKIYPSISLATVYRNIAQLCADGVIKSIGVVDGIERYDGDLNDHPHFVCEQCGAVIDIEPEDGDIALKFIEEKYNVEVISRHVLYYGRCRKCLKK